MEFKSANTFNSVLLEGKFNSASSRENPTNLIYFPIPSLLISFFRSCSSSQLSNKTSPSLHTSTILSAVTFTRFVEIRRFKRIVSRSLVQWVLRNWNIIRKTSHWTSYTSFSCKAGRRAMSAAVCVGKVNEAGAVCITSQQVSDIF